MTYDALLASAPPHDKPEFIEYLREHNRVVRENEEWLIIENIKHHRPTRPWYTAFYKKTEEDKKKKDEETGGFFTFGSYRDEKWLSRWYHDWAWLKKASSKTKVKCYHIHIYKPDETP